MLMRCWRGRGRGWGSVLVGGLGWERRWGGEGKGREGKNLIEYGYDTPFFLYVGLLD